MNRKRDWRRMVLPLAILFLAVLLTVAAVRGW